MSSLRVLWSLLDQSQRRKGVALLGLIGFAAVLDGFVVAALWPFLALAFSGRPGSNGVVTDARVPIFGVVGPESRISLLVFFILAVVLSRGTSLVSAALQTRFVFDAGHRWSTNLLRSYLSTPFNRLTQADVARKTRNILAESNHAAPGALRPVLQTAESAAILVAISAVLIRVSTVSALAIAVALAFVYGGFYLHRRRRVHETGVARLDANRIRHKIASEAIGGIKEIKVANLEREFVARFETASRLHARFNAENQNLQGGSQYILEALAISLVVGATVLLSDSSNPAVIPTLGIFVFGMLRMLPAFHRLLANATQLRFFAPVLTTMAEDLEAGPSEAAGAGGRMAFHDSVQLRAVRIHYAGRATPAADDVSLEVRRGQSVGIVGHTGAGKSTVVDVIVGLVMPNSGSVLVDGTPVTNANRAAWQGNIGYVPQRIFLADDSIRANIAFGDKPEQIDDARVAQVIEVAQLTDFIASLPDKAGTIVGERGVRLSGGQQQRIGIARALYRQPRLLVLDEATSDLDIATQTRILDALHREATDMAVLVVAHRHEAVYGCSIIYVMDSGRVIGVGGFDEVRHLVIPEPALGA